jgi:hypothetical protein
VQFQACILANTTSCTLPGGGSTCVNLYHTWKHNIAQWPVTSLTLGSVTYTEAELRSILALHIDGHGLLFLAHQLIAAKLNIAAGVNAPITTLQAIAEADAIIGGLVVPPVGTDFLSTTDVGGPWVTLQVFNEGGAGVPRCTQ